MSSARRAKGSFKAAGLLVALAVACGDDGSVTQPPTGGGQRNAAYPCGTGPINNAWRISRLSGNLDLPVRCPYQVDAPNQHIDYAASLFIPRDNAATGNQGATQWPIVSLIDGLIVVPSQDRFWTNDPNNSSGYTLQFTNRYIAAHYVPEIEGPFSHDSGRVTSATVHGTAEGYVRLSGSSVAQPGFLIVPAAQTGYPAALRAVTDVDTGSYDFAWRVDGSDVPGNNDADLNTTFWTPGNHEVIAFARYHTGVDTIRATVYSAFVASILGPGAVSAGTYNTWTANVPGGFTPYSYSWYVDHSLASTGSQLTQIFGANESHNIQLHVSDSHGYYDSDQLTVQSGGQCTECGTNRLTPQLRPSAASPSTPLAPAQAVPKRGTKRR